MEKDRLYIVNLMRSAVVFKLYPYHVMNGPDKALA